MARVQMGALYGISSDTVIPKTDLSSPYALVLVGVADGNFGPPKVNVGNIYALSLEAQVATARVSNVYALTLQSVAEFKVPPAELDLLSVSQY